MTKRFANAFGTFLSTLNQTESPREMSLGDVKIQLLDTLKEKGPMTLPELVTASGVSSPMVIESIEPMVGLDLVKFTRRSNDEDAESEVEITPTGVGMVARV